MSQTAHATLRSLLRQRVLVLDGAMGTQIQDLNLDANAFGGEPFDGCNEYLVLTAPEVIEGIHTAYLEAGCDIIETNTFGGAKLVLDEYGLGARAHEINLAAARLARRVADRFSTADQPRFVAGAMGPTTKALSVTGGVTFDELVAQFDAQARALIEGGVDYLLLETSQDTRNVKAGMLGIHRALAACGRELPVAVSGTIEATGTMLAGQSVEALHASLAHWDLLYLGLNCATGPAFMTDHVRALAAVSRFPIACVPNAGLPDTDGRYSETPLSMTGVLRRFGTEGWVNLIGGCCGTTPAHIAAFAKLAEELAPRRDVPPPAAVLSGIDFVEITDDNRPVMVAERTNVIGSRKFKRLIAEDKLDEAAEIGRNQTRSGALVIDVCLANPDRDENADTQRFLSILTRKTRAPIMIDSTDAAVIETALKLCQGKALINSINLEDGLERFNRVVPLARTYGAALVVGCMDEDPEQGMAVTRARKLAIAERSYRILTEDFGVPPGDIYFDPLVFPCATGDVNYIGSAAETIEGTRLIKQRFPTCRTVLGISNVSFGLPPAGREILNAVFLYHCVDAGLDLALVNTEKLERFTRISDADRQLAEDLLFNRGDDPIAAFAARFRDRQPKPPVDRTTIPLDQRLANCIIEGTREGLIEDLDEKLRTTRPLDIINGPLMDGMDEVGRLFNDRKLIVAEVLQSAEAMKAAVSHLEPLMDKRDDASRGSVLLATVKGDVHDIGKNLVEIILGNNGFNVVNLGIKVPPARLIAAIRDHHPDIVGLSGLLVKSAQMMVVTVEDFTRAGIDVPVLVGGAALTEKFAVTRIDQAYGGVAAYAADAMKGLNLAKRLVEAEGPARIRAQLDARRQALAAKSAKADARPQHASMSTQRSGALPVIATPPAAPDNDRHVLDKTPIEQLWPWINPRMLFGRHLGVKGAALKILEQVLEDPAAIDRLEDVDPVAYRTWQAVEEVKDTYRGTDPMRPMAVYRFFPCHSEGNTLWVYDAEQHDQLAATFQFPREAKPDGQCLADLATPRDGAPDNLCMFVTTVGRGTRDEAAALSARGEFLKSHILLAMAVESAEAYAEWLHLQIRRWWGVFDAPELTKKDIFQAKYRGRRYSFGYPACPELKDQKTLWQLLRPDEIGCRLTEELMMDPESSVSAVAFHHPDATYFSVG